MHARRLDDPRRACGSRPCRRRPAADPDRVRLLRRPGRIRSRSGTRCSTGGPSCSSSSATTSMATWPPGAASRARRRLRQGRRRSRATGRCARGAGPGDLGRPRLRPERRRRRFSLQAAGQGAVPRFWKLPADDPRRTPRGHLSCRGLRPGGHAAAGDPARHRATSARRSCRPTSAARRARSAICPTPIRPRPCWARRSGLAASSSCAAGGAAPDRVLDPGPGRGPWLGALGQPAARARRLIDLIAATRANGVVFLSGDRHCRGAVPARPACPTAVRDHLERPQHVLCAVREAGPLRLGAGLRRRELRHDRDRLVGAPGHPVGARAQRRAGAPDRDPAGALSAR